jgi:hypothetical protein
MERTRFEWTLVALSFAGGCWGTWFALTRVDPTHGPTPAVFVPAPAAATDPMPGSTEDPGTPPQPGDAPTATAAEAASPVTRGERLQRSALAEWQKLKERADESRWKRELTEGVGGTAEKLWSGVRGALGAGPNKAAPEAAPAVLPTAAEESKAPPDPAPPKPQPPGSQIGNEGRQNGTSERLGGLLRRFLGLAGAR